MALLRNKSPKLTLPNDWKVIDQQTQALIASILAEKLPLTSQKLDCLQDEDYRNLLTNYQEQYSENLPETNQVAHEIAYEYLLEVAKSLVKTLKTFTCHEEEYLEGLSDA
jgi:hypothetical protein